MYASSEMNAHTHTAINTLQVNHLKILFQSIKAYGGNPLIQDISISLYMQRPHEMTLVTGE